MEVNHAHSHGNKRFIDYLAEFFMIFLAVTAGYIAETIREHSSDNKRSREYISSFIADLKDDTAQIGQVTPILFRNISGSDSLITLLKGFNNSDSSIKKAYHYYLLYTIGVPQVLFNERTITQLLSSGNMRLIDHNISDSIMDYSTIVKFNKLQADYNNQQFSKCFDFSTNIFDFSVALNPIKDNFTRTYKTLLDTGHLQVTNDPQQIRKYCNELAMLQSIIEGYVVNLRLCKKFSTNLISLLNKKYKFDNDGEK